MEYTRKMIADKIGCTKQTVAAYAKDLDLGGHVTRRGQTDYYDEFAASAIAARASGRFSRYQEERAGDPSDLVQVMLEHYKSEVERLRAELEAVEGRHEAEVNRIRQLLDDERELARMMGSQAAEANARAADAEARAARLTAALSAVESAPFWRKGGIARSALALPAPGDGVE